MAFRIVSPMLSPEMTIVITTGGQITGASVDGQPLDLATYAPASDGELLLSYPGITEAEIEVQLFVTGTEPVVVEIRETGYGLPSELVARAVSRTDARMQAAGLPPDGTIIDRIITIP
jgi:hypothetical protein